MENLELFRLFRGISNLITLFMQLVLLVFCMLTSGLMFTLVDEKFDSKKVALAISLSIHPVILNCLIYIIVLYDVDKGGSMHEMLYQPSSIGLSLADMEEISYLSWLGFYLFLAVLTRHKFGVSYGKAAAITFIPTLLVVLGRLLWNLW
ncbi:MAG: hypothetical protein WD426_00480 [Anditalea sp.]